MKGYCHLTSSKNGSRYEWGKMHRPFDISSDNCSPSSDGCISERRSTLAHSAISNPAFEENLEIEIHPWQNAAANFVIEDPAFMKSSQKTFSADGYYDRLTGLCRIAVNFLKASINKQFLGPKNLTAEEFSLTLFFCIIASMSV